MLSTVAKKSAKLAPHRSAIYTYRARERERERQSERERKRKIKKKTCAKLVNLRRTLENTHTRLDVDSF